LVEHSTVLKSLKELRSPSISDTIKLDIIKGIVDDFSYDGPFPDTSIWLDNDVFINKGYGKAPITIGVATFDGLDASGYPYNFFVSPTSSLPADSLTSKPIDLSDPTFDSIYLSFYYQPQGLGEKPEVGDSLVLEFKAPGDSTEWIHKWSQRGTTLAATDSSWGRVMIPVTDSIFLKKGFQFRFRNYATLSGNLDHWHIDYVYLNTQRKISDTVFNDISWVYQGVSLLQNYRVMPWNQYLPSELRTTVPNLIRNNDASTHNINYNYLIRNDNLLSTIGTFNGAANIYPFIQNNLFTDCDVPAGCIDKVDIPASAFPDILTEPTQFTLKHYYKKTIGDLVEKNDTLNVRQNFTNYFAYDDGTAESAVGLNVLNAQLAEQFVLNVGDTLQCVDIYFNPVVTNANLYAFSLNVWNDIGGKPGDLIYTSPWVLSPEYIKLGQNKFTRYPLETPLYLNPGVFYIGFTQKTDQFLNVGEDKNTNSQNKVFYKVSGGWNNSPFYGSLMMRPYLGLKADLIGIEELGSKKESSISVYPNPANDKLYVRLDLNSISQKISYTIIDLFGRTIVENTMNELEYIDISAIAEGVYFIRVLNGAESFTSKFVKVN
jgi:hypothetical protein